MSDPQPVRDGSENLASVPRPGPGILEGFRLDGRVAVVTGAGRGIGRAVALALAEVGANVVVLARSLDQLEAVVGEIHSGGGEAMALPLDVTDAEAVRKTCGTVMDRLGAVDIVVNNAGNLIAKPFVPLPGITGYGETGDAPTADAEWRGVFDTHASSAFYLLRELAPAMLERGRGRVINIVSNSLSRHVPFISTYDVAKAALVGLTHTLAFEWARYGVTVNAIAPGHFHTALTAPLHENPESRKWMLKRIPMRREGDLREIGALAAYLASDWAAFLTGQIITIDGGEFL